MTNEPTGAPLELDEVGHLEWRVYELEGRLASIEYEHTKKLAERPPVRPCVTCGRDTIRKDRVCLFCEREGRRD